MGLDFLGNPNKVEHSSDELEFDSGDEGGGGGGGGGGGAFWLASLDDAENEVDVDGDVFIEGIVDDDDDDDDDYLDTEDDEESVDDYDIDDEREEDLVLEENNLNFFFDSGDDDADDEDGELRLTLVNGQYVQTCPTSKTLPESVEGGASGDVNSDSTCPETSVVKDASTI